ncbi:MAG: thiosulfate oxidation carrier complex protein SoxZ, partial [Candidatus Sedimenticola endophacoides]
TVMSALFSGGVSKNPYVSFKYAGKKGDALTMSWSDNQGDSDSIEVKVG